MKEWVHVFWGIKSQSCHSKISLLGPLEKQWQISVDHPLMSQNASLEAVPIAMFFLG